MCSALVYKLENAPLDMEIIYDVRENKIDTMDGTDIVNSNLPYWICWTDEDEYNAIVERNWKIINEVPNLFINYL